MLRIATLIATIGLLAGCSSPSSDQSPSPTPEQSSAGFFTQTETDALNAAYTAYPAALTAATADQSVKRCNAMQTADRTWVKCWTSLLTPVEKAIAATAAGMKEVAGNDELRAECRDELRTAATGFTKHEDAVANMIEQFQGSTAAQRKVAKAYYDTLTTYDQKIPKMFQAITQVCYSPEDLAEIEASQSATPSTSPSTSP